MRDTLKSTKDTLLSLIQFLRENGGLPSEDGAEEIVEVLLRRDFPDYVRYVPCCLHCGSDNVIEGDFKDELFLDMSGHWTKEADPKSAGPAWVCQEKDCHTYSPREAP